VLLSLGGSHRVFEVDGFRFEPLLFWVFDIVSDFDIRVSDLLADGSSLAYSL
jgi:hypothetical protein